MPGFDMLCVPHTEMCPEQFMPEPVNPWANSVLILIICCSQRRTVPHKADKCHSHSDLQSNVGEVP